MQNGQVAIVYCIASVYCFQVSITVTMCDLWELIYCPTDNGSFYMSVSQVIRSNTKLECIHRILIPCAASRLILHTIPMLIEL